MNVGNDGDGDGDGDKQEQWRMVATTLIAMTTASVVYIMLRLNREPKEPTVSALYVYPIKSCGPMKVQSAMVTEIGFSYDLFAQVSDSDGNYLTPRDGKNARLFHVKPSIIHDRSNIHLEITTTSTSNNNNNKASTFRIENLNETIEKSKTTKEVTPMIGPKVKLEDLGDEVALWLSNITDIKDCRLTAIGPKYHRLIEMNPDQGEPVPLPIKKDIKVVSSNKSISITSPPAVSLADEAPFLLTSSSSLKDLNSRLKARGKESVDMQRFRPNIVVSGMSLLPWEEDTWKRIKIGGMEFHVWQRCGRCSMTTIDRITLKRGPEPLATLSTFRERENGMRNFGMHMTSVSDTASMEYTETSLVHVGQKLEVLEYDQQRLKEWKRLFPLE